MAKMNFLYGNATGTDIHMYHEEIAAALLATGELPEDLNDVFEARLVPAEHGNPDGTPRYMIFAR